MIKIPATLGRYLSRLYVSNLLMLLVLLAGIIYLFDTVELLRRAGKRADVPLSVVLEMGALKIPEAAQVTLPFAILFSAMFTFWQLGRRSELAILRNAGLSVWQFLSPLLAVAVLAGFLHMMAINPVGSVFLAKYDQLERDRLTREKSLVSLFRGGLWLRQPGPEGDGEVILHAGRIQLPEWRLHNVMALFFSEGGNLIRRIDAPDARLEKGEWIFEKPVINAFPGQEESPDTYTLPTEMTTLKIEESFSSPESMSFWHLPGHIGTLESAGFDATRLHIHFQNLLSQPLLFAAMILLAACVSLRPPRAGGAALFAGLGLMVAFVVFFMSSYLQAMGAAHQIPSVLAAWSPALICLLSGIGVILHLEDG
ncbi:MAG: LPS export ABC transporter permease LptG [Rhodospirillales bacterium]|nr:LPS export ABC transporter permease LptG [Rhodospirillales bacterium]